MIGAEARKKSATGVEVPEVSLAEAKAQVAADPGPENDTKGANGLQPEHEFDLDILDDRGRRWNGRFKCHVLTFRERIQVGLVRSRLSGGVPPAALDNFTATLLEMIAHLSVALDDSPEWAKDLMGLYASEVVGAIYEEVADHEGRFRGTVGGKAGESADQGPSVPDGEGVVP